MKPFLRTQSTGLINYRNQAAVWLGLFFLPFAVSWHFLEAYITPKWICVYLGCFLLLLAATKTSTIEFPRLERRVLSLVLILAGLEVFNYFHHEKTFFSETFLQRMTFVGLTLLFFNCFKKNLLQFKDIITPLFLATFCFLLSSFNFSLHFPFMYFGSGASSSFGNINMAAEFFGFSLILQLNSLGTFKSHQAKLFLYGLICFSLVYVYFALCRSVYLGLAFALLYLMCIKRGRIKEYLSLLSVSLILYGIIGVGEFGSLKNFYDNEKAGTAFKHQSANERLNLWQATKNLIIEKPLGVGQGNFEYSFIPYKRASNLTISEDLIEKAPHNEFLRYLSEEGVIFSVVLFILAGFIVVEYFVLQRLKEGQEDIKSPLFFSLIIFLSVEMFFQFPLDNPFPFFLMSCLSGYFLAVQDSVKEAPMTFSLRKKVVAFFCVIYGLLFSSVIISDVLWFNYSHNMSLAKLACKITPANSSASLTANMLLANARFKEAQQVAQKQLSKKPYSFPFLKILGLSYLYQEDFEKGCKALLLYDTLFYSRSSVKDIIASHCQSPNKGGISKGDFNTYYKKNLAEMIY